MIVSPPLFLVAAYWWVREGKTLPVTSDGSLYIGPAQLVSPWRSLSPEAIDCRSSVGRYGFEMLENYTYFTTIKWTPHMTLPTSGFSCYGLVKKTRCSRSFFSYDSIERSTERFLPSPTECREQYQKYRESHPIGVDFPFPSCHWMGDDVEESRGVMIMLNPVEYDPFHNLYRDHLLAEGICKEPPCLTSDKKSYWFNSTSPTVECRREPEIKIYVPASLIQVDPRGVDFMSLSLQAKTFKGACRKEYCGKEGVLLHTQEWIEKSRGMTNNFPKLSLLKECYEKNKTYATHYPAELITHVLHEYQHDELYRDCKKIQDKLILGEAISRTDLQYLVPTSEGRGPVFRLHNSTIQVASGVYRTMVYPEDNTGSLRGYTIGYTLNHSDPILWNDPIRVNQDIVDGPNGMFWYRGRLIHPGRWGGRIREVTRHLSTPHLVRNEDAGILHHDTYAGKESDGREYTSPWIIRPVAHLSLLESILLLLAGVFLVLLAYKLIKLKCLVKAERNPAAWWSKR